MSNMSRALIFALVLSTATAADYEWKGIFYTPDATYKWGAQKVDGGYVDPTMILVAIPTSGATAEDLTQATSAGATAMGLECEDVESGGTITPMENKCYKLVFDQSSSQSVYTVDASSAGSIAFFAEHLPTEFEATDHYFKDTSGADIEPVAQDPDGGEGHSHGGDGGTADEFDGICVCQAQKHGWKIDCGDKAKIEEAVNKLKAKADCKKLKAPQDCQDMFYNMQTHHDHCLHDQLPMGIENALHDYEHFYTDCFIKRQFDPELPKCPEVDCNDATAMTTAIATLQGNEKCTTNCADAECAAAIKLVLMVHDVCSEAKLPNNLETALHSYEDPCAAQLCNSGDAVFDPYDSETASNQLCKAELSAARGFGGQGAFLVTMSALLLAVLFSS